MRTLFISGHRDLSPDEFRQHYADLILEAINRGHLFILGDYDGADAMAAKFLALNGGSATVYHMGDEPLNQLHYFPTIGGFTSDEERDAAMTRNSHADIAWVRPGKESSGTALNLLRRQNQHLVKVTSFRKEDTVYAALEVLTRGPSTTARRVLAGEAGTVLSVVQHTPTDDPLLEVQWLRGGSGLYGSTALKASL